MAAEAPRPPPVEFAHVLVAGIVDAARLPDPERRRQLDELAALLTGSLAPAPPDPRAAPLRHPFEEGLALVFFQDFIAPVAAALRLLRDLESRSYLRVRVGLHSGPV